MKRHIAILILGILTGCSSQPPDNVRYHNPLQWRISKAIDEVPGAGFTHISQEEEAIRQAVLTVLKGKTLKSLLDVETTQHGAYQPIPYIRKNGSIRIPHGDMDYDLTPVIENGVIVDFTIARTPICIEIDVVQ